MAWVLSGNIQGPPGEDGEQGEQGIKGDAGINGRAIETADINTDGDLILTFSDAPDGEVNLGKVVGAAGTPADAALIDTHLGGDATNLIATVQANGADIVWITDALPTKADLDSPAFTGTVTGITKDDVGLANVDNTTDANKPVSAAQNAVNALKAPKDSPAFTGTPTGITKTHVGLPLVDNTADSSKPISTAQAAVNTAQGTTNTNIASAASSDATTKANAAQAAAIAAAATDATTKANAVGTTSTAALALKAPLASPAFTGTPTGITKAHVGLSSVDNTSDANKPISTAQAAVNTAQGTTNTSIANAASTDATTKASAAQAAAITAAATDATTKASAAQTAAIAAAATDATTKDDAALSTTNASLALKAPLASPAFTGTPTGITKAHVGLSNVDNTADDSKPVSAAQAAALVAKAGSTLDDGANLAVGTVTGTQIATSAAQKIGFYGAAPVVQPFSTQDIGTALSNLGLRATGTAWPITTSGAVAFSGNLRMTPIQRGAVATLTTASPMHSACDATTASFVLTLPATATSGYIFTFTKTDATANTVTVLGTVINSGTSYVLTRQGQSVTVMSTTTSGTWVVIAETHGVPDSTTAELSTVLSNAGLRAASTTMPFTSSGLLSLTGPLRLGATARATSATLTAGTTPPYSTVDATAGSVVMTLVPLSTPGYLFSIKKTDASANTVTVTATSGTIDGAASIVLSLPSQSVTVMSTTVSGVWVIVDSSVPAGIAQSATQDLGTVLSTAGLRASGAYALQTAGIAYFTGPMRLGLTARTAAITLTAGVHGPYNPVDATSGAVTVTLAATPTSGMLFFIKKTDASANAVTVTPASGTIDGAASVVLTAQYQSVTLMSTSVSGVWINLTPPDSTKAPLASPAFTGTPTGITKTHVGLGSVDNTSDLAKPISTATQTALNTKSSRIDLVATSLPSFATVGHRCGANIYPEESMEALEACIRDGIIPELDLQQLSDGTLVGCHDDTVDRTMLNIGTGNVNTKTAAQWRAAEIKPKVVGGKTGTPIFWENVLNLYGGRALITPELKDGDTATATAYIASMTSRNLGRALITQCFNYTTCTTLAAAGLEAMYLSTNLPAQSAATIKAAGINFVCFSLSGNVTAANVTAFKAAGLKVFFYTVNDKIDQAAVVTLGADGCFSNDPWLTSDRIPISSSDTFDEGIWPKGAANFHYVGTTYTDEPIPAQLNGRKIGYAVGVSPIPYLLLPDMGLITRPCRISMRLHFGLTGGLTTNLGFSLMNPASGFILDGAKTGQNGFNAVCRRNGQLQIWQFVNGAASASIGAFPTTATAGVNEVAPLGQESIVDFTAIFTTTTIELIAQSPRYTSTNGSGATTPPAYGYSTTGAMANTLNPSGGMDFYLRFISSGAGWISDVSVTPG